MGYFVEEFKHYIFLTYRITAVNSKISFLPTKQILYSKYCINECLVRVARSDAKSDQRSKQLYWLGNRLYQRSTEINGSLAFTNIQRERSPLIYDIS